MYAKGLALPRDSPSVNCPESVTLRPRIIAFLDNSPCSPAFSLFCPRLRELCQLSPYRHLRDRLAVTPTNTRRLTIRMASPKAENGRTDHSYSPGPSPSAQFSTGHDQASLHQAQPPKRKRPRPENPRSAIGYPRKRAVAACQSCRARKIKCNNARPACGRCLSAMIPCVYEDTQDLSSRVTSPVS